MNGKAPQRKPQGYNLGDNYSDLLATVL